MREAVMNMMKAVIKRHIGAVTLISKAVLTGNRGGDVVSMDVSEANQAAEGVPHTRPRMPTRILPRQMPQEKTKG